MNHYRNNDNDDDDTESIGIWSNSNKSNVFQDGNSQAKHWFNDLTL